MENIYKINGEAVKKIAERVYDNGSTVINRNDLEEMFPELKESDDEKIRKWIIAYLENRVMNTSITDEKDNCLDAIRWLEKQGEQKSTDKIEQKFKVGDFIVNDYCMGKVIELTSDAYLLDTGQGIPFSHEHNAHLWTIQDAKDGDVLSWDDSKCITIFKNIYDEDSFNSYGFVGGCTGTIESRQSYHDIEGAHPATKEQRNLLEKAMAGAGYVFDFEKKELKKIEQKKEDTSELTEFEAELFSMMSDAWQGYLRGEEVNIAEIVKEHSSELLERANEQKPAWSEEGEKMLNRAIKLISPDNNHSDYAKYKLQIVEWLKSLRPQNTWKPSDEHYELEEFAKIVRSNLAGISKAVQKLFEAKYLQLTGNKMYGGYKD